NPMDARTGDPGEFVSHPRWQRLLIAVAGPTMNILLAVGIVTGVFMVHYSHDWYLDQPTRVGWVEENSPAAKAGLMPGDLITQIDGVSNPLWEDTKAKITISPQQPLPITLKRGDKSISSTLIPDTYGPSHAGEAGLEPAGGITVEGAERYRIGFSPGVRQHIDRLTFSEALSRSVETNKKYAFLLVELVEKMVQRKVSVKMMSGPIDIAKVSGEAAREPGWTPLLLLMAGISLNLGIFNLFPIPILDGGVILPLLIEGLMRRDISLH